MLGEAGIDLADIDRIAYGWNAGFDAGRHLDLYLDRVPEEAREASPRACRTCTSGSPTKWPTTRPKRGEFDAFVRANNGPARQGRAYRTITNAAPSARSSARRSTRR
ncbi:hypothetical protein P4114_25420 [Pseudomonas aeruginosa]|nr:hypothetical protein [Pseudomonas aeruginosa]